MPVNMATLMPNTFLMQEFMRTAYDNYLDDRENSLTVELPFIFIIQKGTVLPTSLVLLREQFAQFSLQPSLPTSTEDFIDILTEFYSTHADKREAFEWLADYQYCDAFADDKENEWMAK